MQDKKLYQQILGLSPPLASKNFELDKGSLGKRFRVEPPRGNKLSDPDCNTELLCHAHAEERRWRHFDSCQFKTILIARQPQVNYPTHRVKTVLVIRAERSRCFILMFVRFAINVFLATQTVAGASSLLRPSRDETWSILEKAVERGNARKINDPMRRIGMDEKALRKGQSYITLIYDLDRSTAKAISEGNDIHAGNTAFLRFPKNNCLVLKRLPWT